MKLIGKQPSAEVQTEYRKLGHRIARDVWMNLSRAVESGSDGNGELRRFLRCKY